MINYHGIHGIQIRWRNGSIASEYTVIGQVVYSPGGECGPRRQKDYELVIIHSGECTLQLDDQSLSMVPGAIYLMHPGRQEYYLFSKNKETHHSWCTVGVHAIPKYLNSQLSQMPNTLSLQASKTFELLLQSAFHLDATLTGNTNQVIDSIGIALFNEFVNIHSKVDQNKKIDTCVSKAVSYMEQHFMNDDCLKQAHNHSGVSRNTLINKFNTGLSISPANYLWKLRTEKGISMLIHTGLSVEKIAYHCGFKNPFHFSRKVKEFQGCSPRSLRTNT